MRKSYPLVTSIVLCYKKFDYIYEAIESILSQDYPQIELIISDDASENFPEKEIRNYIKQNKKDNLVDIKILINESNIGTVRNFNNAIKAGNGEYYIDLAGDDVFFDSTVIRRVVERFEETGYEILSCRRLRCTEDGMKPLMLMPNNTYLSIIGRINTPEKQYHAFAVRCHYEMASGSSTYFSKKHFEKWGFFDESYFLWEDGPFYAKYTRCGNIIPTAYDIISIRYREGGVSGGKPNQLMIDDYNRFVEVECYKYLNNFNKMDRRYISFLYQRLQQEYKSSKWNKILFYIRYFDAVIRRLYYRYFCLFINIYENKMFEKHYHE